MQATRKRLGLTQTEAARLAMRKLRAWQDAETSPTLDRAAWALFLIRTGEAEAGDIENAVRLR